MIVRIIKRIFGGLFGLLAIGLAGYTGYEVFRYGVNFDLSAILFGTSVMLLVCLLSSGLLSWSVKEPLLKHRFMTAGMVPLFSFYSFVLISLLFTSRHFFFSYLSEYGILERIKYTANFIPLRTILRYLTHANEYNASVLWENLAGNLFLLLPMGFFLPLFFKKLRHAGAYVITLFAMTVLIELIQLLFGIGTFDVDDILLNMIGGVAGFFLFRISLIQRLQKAMYYLS